ncbi:hypothetical protein Celal_1391 [Cellulophaga algicola DSM 14237]|uniref:DUF7689 domain-containing protein n=1 Tax=Cellulophaga algicola (strain DSM 14237 / IC166 / ACAM 630) TaxID=688270 RepID=E6X8V9_CELAD|nr:hypothetical protein [Cellulophaga algicola]ADV48704.1 hypothetical protein Celal_1391 [Cellulophaga algicola DSM 14237]
MINSDSNRNKIIKVFPKLLDDKSFKIIGNITPNYNCIAWAANVTDCWWSSLPLGERPTHGLDGVKYDWPFEVDDEFSIKTLTEIFTFLKYVECENYDYEEGFKKVAFYVKDGRATHAARQLTAIEAKGIWSSKLGASFLIHHGTPYDIESDAYGIPVKFMKKNMN